MNNIVSIFSGVKPLPIGETDWISVIENIRSDKYQKAIEDGRKIADINVYREYKKKLPAVTFCANFSKNRDKHNVLAATGFLIPDLDHLPDVDATFDLLSQDENIWFIFRSPSGTGLKCGIRAKDIKTDEDIKKLYAAVERYFRETYSLKIDPSCKDIARLTFVSYDPKLFVNPTPFYFNIPKWIKPFEQKFYAPPEQNNGWKSKYGQKVLDSCCLEISQSAGGQLHDTRLRMSLLVGGYIATGFIDEAQALSALEIAVGASGSTKIPQAMKTVQDGIKEGKTKPLQPEKRIGTGKKDDIQYYCDTNEAFNDLSAASAASAASAVSAVSAASAASAFVSDLSAGCQQDGFSVSSVSRISVSPAGHDDTKTPKNLAVEIKEWILNSGGYFTVEQVDREFCLTSRTEKNNRAQVLTMCVNKKLVKKDKRIKGKYHVINSDLPIIDIFNTDETAFKIRLPFYLDQYVSIPKKAIIIIAGSSNAGKTALILNILKLNLSQQYKKLYLMSEMGTGEYVDRLKKFDDVQFPDWKNIQASERTSDFDGAIEHHNRDGLTCIDFLEEVDGEYFKIPTDIRDIYDSLGEGIAVIAIQKKSDTDYARGGQATAEKARLYMAVDLITVLDRSIVCALKIIKNKRFVGRNLQGHEIHFKIHSGSKIEPLCDWVRSSVVDRNNCKSSYEKADANQPKDNTEMTFEFKTISGKTVGLTKNDYLRWKASYSNIDLDEQLEELANSSYRKSWFTEKDWFFSISGILNKRNDIQTAKEG